MLNGLRRTRVFCGALLLFLCSGVAAGQGDGAAPPQTPIYLRIVDGFENGRVLSDLSPGDDDLVPVGLNISGLPAETDVWIETPEGENRSLLEFHSARFGPYLGEVGWLAWLWPFGEDQRPVETQPKPTPIQFPLKAAALGEVDTGLRGVYALATPVAFPDPCSGQPRTEACAEPVSLSRSVTFYFGTWGADPEKRVVQSEQAVTFQVVRGPGDPNFFHAARAYIERFGSGLYVCERRYDFPKAWEDIGEMDRVRDVSRIVVFPAERTRLDVLETYYRPGPDGNILWSIDRVVEAHPGQTVIVNGNYFFTNTEENDDTPGRGQKATPHPKQIRGRLIHDGVKSPVSTQRKVDDHNPTKCGLPEYYIAQDDDQLYFAEGKVPLVTDSPVVAPDCDPAYVPDGREGTVIAPDPDPAMASPLDEALGGLHQMHGQESASRMRASMVGAATTMDGNNTEQRLIFVVSNVSGSGLGNEDLVKELKRSGAVRAEGADNIYQLDTGGSVALAYPDEYGRLRTQIRSGRHEEPNQNNISNYLMFRVDAPQ